MLLGHSIRCFNDCLIEYSSTKANSQPFIIMLNRVIVSIQKQLPTTTNENTLSPN